MIKLAKLIGAREPYLIDGKKLNSLALENHIKVKYNFIDISNFSDFLIGESEKLKMEYFDNHGHAHGEIPASKNIKENVNNFNLYIKEVK